MSRRFVLAAWALAAALGTMVVEACIFQTTNVVALPSGDAGTADAASEATDDGGVDADAAPDVPCPSGVRCNGQCLTTSDCRACTGSPLLCAGTGDCVSSCAGCSDTQGAALPIECFSCDTQHANPIGTCGSADPLAYCLSGNYYGSYDGGNGYHCACPGGNVSACPGESQVCIAFGSAAVCASCGEPMPSGSTAVACKKSHTTCDPSAHACK